MLRFLICLYNKMLKKCKVAYLKEANVQYLRLTMRKTRKKCALQIDKKRK